MKKKSYKSFVNLLFTFGLLFFYTNSNSQIASWTYEPPQGTINNPTSNTGTGTSSVINFGGGTVTPGSRTGMSPSSALAGCGTQDGVTAWALEPFDPGTFNESNGVQFNGSTIGYQNITFTWDQRWSNTAANTVRLQYTTDGSTWISFNMTAGNTTFCDGSINANGCFEANINGDRFRRTSVNFSAILAANNNPNFGVRLLASHYQSTGQFRQVSTPASIANPLGTWRFDNVAFTGTLFPGPTASVISGTTSICQGNSANIRVTITGGVGPFTVVYTNGTTNFTVNNYISASNILVTPASTNTYTIVSVANANGALGSGNSGAAVITVNSLPAIPTATNITVCGTAAYAMTGGSAPPIGHTGSYSIGSPYSGPTTTFTYTITNTVTGCSRTSPTYTFTRNAVPTIVTPPSPSGTQTVCQGSPFLPITVVASGTGITYQWYRNTAPVGLGTVALTGASYPLEIANGSKTATFTPLSNTVGVFYYYVRINGVCSPFVNSAWIGPITVLAPAVAGTASNDQTISCGITPTDLTVTGFTNTVIKWQYATDFAFTTPIDIPSSNSATLTAIQIGAITTTRYFRAVIDNSTCLAYSNVVTLTLGISTTWNGTSWTNGLPNSTRPVIFDGNYNSSGNLSACSVTIINGANVTFLSGHSLIVENSVDTSGGTLTFNDDASLVQLNNVVNSPGNYNGGNIGNISYLRNTAPMVIFDYTYWSSPVYAQTLFGVSPLTLSDKYFHFNTTTYQFQSVISSTVMTPGKGYIIRAPQGFPSTSTIYSATFGGVPNSGTITTPIEYTNPTKNLNLIGNPYPSALNADLFLTDPINAKLDATIYLWTHTTPIAGGLYNGSDYALYNFSGGIGTGTPVGGSPTPNGRITAGQSFFIKALATSLPGDVATFKNTMRVIGNNSQFFRNSQANTSVNTISNLEKNRIWLEITNATGLYKQTLIGYIENATNDLDRGFDGEIVDTGNPLSLYSVINQKKLGIQGRALPFDINDIVPLGFKAATSGTYEIRLSDFDGFFVNQNVFLEDKLVNVIHNLKESNYSFVTNSGTFEDRFVLRFTDTISLHSNQSEFNENAITIYKENKNLIINSMLIDIKDVEIVDLMGRLLFTKSNIQSSNENISIDGFSTAILIVKIQLINGQTITKKFLK